MSEAKRPVGWPKGKKRGIGLTHDQGQDEWTWNGALLLSKIDSANRTDDECHPWLGSRGPNGNLFGANKNGGSQMTQANRLIYAQMTGENVFNMAVRMKCYDRYCANVNHMELKPYARWKTLD
jgi:hypothetical protein